MARKKGKCGGGRGAGWDKGYGHVTTINGNVLAKDGLMYWYGKVGIAEANRIKLATAAYGTRAHRIIASAIFNPLGVSKVGEYEEFKNRIKFLNEEIERRGLMPVEAEKNVVCDEYQYCGTLDGLFRKNQSTHEAYKTEHTIWDIKTGTKLPFEVLLQLAAYAYCIDPTFESVDAFVVYIGRTDEVQKDKKGVDIPCVDVLSYTGQELKVGFELFKCVLQIYNGKKLLQFGRKKRKK